MQCNVWGSRRLILMNLGLTEYTHIYAALTSNDNQEATSIWSNLRGFQEDMGSLQQSTQVILHFSQHSTCLTQLTISSQFIMTQGNRNDLLCSQEIQRMVKKHDDWNSRQTSHIEPSAGASLNFAFCSQVGEALVQNSSTWAICRPTLTSHQGLCTFNWKRWDVELGRKRCVTLILVTCRKSHMTHNLVAQFHQRQGNWLQSWKCHPNLCF